MRRLKQTLATILLAGACLSFLPVTSSTAFARAPAPAVRLGDDVVRARAETLIAQMTPEEKAGQLSQFFYFQIFPPMNARTDAAIAAGGAGSLLFVTDPAYTNRLQHVAVDKTRLKIPLLFGFDVIHGLHTIFPVPLGMAASWDPGMVEQAQGVAASEARAVGVHWAFAPMVDIARDPRWGRMVEGAAEFARAVSLAQAADVAVLVLGEGQDMIGESASRSGLDLPGRQQALLDAVVATGKPVVVVLMNGRPLDLKGTKAGAILEAWYPGSAGGEAVANLLLGDATPGGRLPSTWIRDAAQAPNPYAHLISHDPAGADKRYWNGSSEPTWPFGHGLSYTSFQYANLKVERPVYAAGEPVTVTVDLKNTGARAGDEVAQLYIHQRYGTSARPIRELKGFQRVALKPGEIRTLRFTLTADDLRYWSAATGGWVQDQTAFDVWVGGDSKASLAAGFEVKSR